MLASIILVSLIGIFRQYQDFLRYARRSFSEAFVWMATFVATILLDVDLGLLVGLVVSLMFLVAWGYFPKIEVIATTDFDDVFLQAGKFEKVIFVFCSSRTDSPNTAKLVILKLLGFNITAHVLAAQQHLL